MNEVIKSPYLQSPNRLSDVIAAIQAMGTYKFYSMTFESWADRISGDEQQADYWKRIFSEHSEFFRLDSTRKRAALVWRRQYPKRYHVDRREGLTADEFDALSDDERERVSRDPLRPEDIRTLVDTAINIHSRALEVERERAWWKSPLLSGIGAATGSIIAAFFRR
jgi:hypothetical protein